MQKLKAKVSKLSYISQFFAYTSPSEYHNQNLEIAIFPLKILPISIFNHIISCPYFFSWNPSKGGLTMNGALNNIKILSAINWTSLGKDFNNGILWELRNSVVEEIIT